MNSAAGESDQLLRFLRHVLPPEGNYVYCWKKADTNWRQTSTTDLEVLADKVRSLSAQGFDTYFAVGAYTIPGVRDAAHSAGIRSFLLDIDAGEGKPYPDARTAAAALVHWCHRFQIPPPTVVMSGSGLHCYWVMDRTLSPAEWTPIARRLKALTEAGGLHCDPTRTADIASVLRPPTTLNYKRPLSGQVTSGGLRSAVSSEWFAALFPESSAPEIIVRPRSNPTGLNAEFMAIYPDEPSHAEAIADQCQWINVVGRQRRGNVIEPLWYALLGLLNFTDEAEEIVHEWSWGHAGYDYDATEEKLAQVRAKQSGPTTCAKFESLWKTPCQTCPHRGKITTPLQLGRTPTVLLGTQVSAISTSIQRAIVTPATAKTESQYTTDLGNARRLVAQHRAIIRYVSAWKNWLVWDGARWCRDADGAISRHAKNTVEAIRAEANRTVDSDTRERLFKHFIASQSVSRIDAMVRLAATEPGIPIAADALDVDPWLLGVQNGVVDLKTGQFREGRPEDLITHCASVAYEANATCPTWLRFLDVVTGEDRELQTYLQQVIGYILTGLVDEEVLLIFFGSGANGKSTFRETAHQMMGSYATAADATMLMERKNSGGPTPEIARLLGVRLVCINETQAEERLNEARVKFLTSTDTITARTLYGAPFDFRPTHKTIITTNHRPIVRGADEGIWRRLHFVPFLMTIPENERDKHFREKYLAPEMSGILNWALAGLASYQINGLKAPTTVQVANSGYRQEMDLIGQWLDERCVVDGPSEISTATAYLDYSGWALTNAGYVPSIAKFGRDMRERGFKKMKRHGGQRVLVGFKLNDIQQHHGSGGPPLKKLEKG